MARSKQELSRNEVIMSEKKIDFEAKLKRLGEITEKMENEVLPLNESLALYEEGKKLIKELHDELQKADDAIKELQK